MRNASNDRKKRPYFSIFCILSEFTVNNTCEIKIHLKFTTKPTLFACVCKQSFMDNAFLKKQGISRKRFEVFVAAAFSYLAGLFSTLNLLKM